MRGFRAFFGTTALLAGLALAPTANAQIVVDIGVQPVCSYGYYGYAPYACAPMGYYGPGYFYNGIFLGMGPWGGWGYSHGWGGHRFVGEGGGSYHGGPGRVSYHENAWWGSSRRRCWIPRQRGRRPSGSGAWRNNPLRTSEAGRISFWRRAAQRISCCRLRITAAARKRTAGGGGGGHQGGGEHR